MRTFDVRERGDRQRDRQELCQQSIWQVSARANTTWSRAARVKCAEWPRETGQRQRLAAAAGGCCGRVHEKARCRQRRRRPRETTCPETFAALRDDQKRRKKWKKMDFILFACATYVTLPQERRGTYHDKNYAKAVGVRGVQEPHRSP